MTLSRTRLTYEGFIRIAPGAQAPFRALGKVVDDSGFDKSLTELVKLRASQINGCAFCIQYHLGVARKLGLAEEKLDLIAAWKESGIFSEKECAALLWAESLTKISRGGASDDDYEAVRKQFSESEVVFLTVAIGTINSWNRIAVAFGFPPGVARRPAK